MFDINKIVSPSQSPKYSLDWRDLGKGTLLAMLAPVVVIAQQVCDTVITQGKPLSSVHLDWRTLVMASIGAGVAYLVKNFFQGIPASEVK